MEDSGVNMMHTRKHWSGGAHKEFVQKNCACSICGGGKARCRQCVVDRYTVCTQ